MTDRYPYFLYPAILELWENPSPERSRELKEFIAANVGSREALLRLTGDLGSEFFNFYEDPDSEASTQEDPIDSFIEKFGGKTRLPADSPLNDLPIEDDEVIEEEDTFEEDDPEIEAEEDYVEEEDEPEEDETITDSEKAFDEAKILVKNGQYEAALEIMEKIYLNNPKKSVYFADQIRFVKKLMLNEQNKTVKSK